MSRLPLAHRIGVAAVGAWLAFDVVLICLTR